MSGTPSVAIAKTISFADARSLMSFASLIKTEVSAHGPVDAKFFSQALARSEDLSPDTRRLWLTIFRAAEELASPHGRKLGGLKNFSELDVNVISLLIEGRSDATIAEKLAIKRRHVDCLVRRLITETKTNNRTRALIKASEILSPRVSAEAVAVLEDFAASMEKVTGSTHFPLGQFCYEIALGRAISWHSTVRQAWIGAFAAAEVPPRSISPEICNRLLSPPLLPVLVALAEGKAQKLISRELGMDAYETRKHVLKIVAILNVPSGRDAAILVHGAGLLNHIPAVPAKSRSEQSRTSDLAC